MRCSQHDCTINIQFRHYATIIVASAKTPVHTEETYNGEIRPTQDFHIVVKHVLTSQVSPKRLIMADLTAANRSSSLLFFFCFFRKARSSSVPPTAAWSECRKREHIQNTIGSSCEHYNWPGYYTTHSPSVDRCVRQLASVQHFEESNLLTVCCYSTSLYLFQQVEWC